MNLLVKVPLGGAVFLTWMGIAFSPRAPSAGPVELDAPSSPTVEARGRLLYGGDALAMPTQIAVVNDRIALVDGFAERPIHVLYHGAELVRCVLGSDGDDEPLAALLRRSR